MPTSPFRHLLFVHNIKNKPLSQQNYVIDAYTRSLLPGTRTNSKRVIWQPMVQELCATPYIYLQMRVLLRPYMTFYDAKPQLVKTPVEGKPSTISPNHTCQCSLLILSYNVCPSYYSIAHYL